MEAPPALLLVAEDPGFALTFSALLEDEGYRVDCAATLAEARARLAPPARYALVLLDAHLSDGAGVALVPLVRERLPGARVVLCSGRARDELGLAAADAVLVKGDPLRDALAAIAALLR